jgi:hypothetical protein
MKFANVTIVSKLCTTYDDRCVCVKSYCLLNPSRRTTSTEYYNLWRLHLPFGFFFRIVVEILRRGSTHNVFAGSVILYECCWFSDSLWMMLGQWFSMNVAGSVILYECCWVSDSLWMMLGQWFPMNVAGSVILCMIAVKTSPVIITDFLKTTSKTYSRCTWYFRLFSCHCNVKHKF